MKQIYAITVGGGQYDEEWERVEFVTEDEEKGKAYITNMEALKARVAAAITTVDEYQANWQAEHPRPAMLKYDPVLIPKWPPGTKITQEMRDERTQLEYLQQEGYAAAHKPLSDWSTAYCAVREAHKATLPEDVVKGMEYISDDTYWTIDAVDWLP